MVALGGLVVAVVGVTGFLAERGLRERETSRIEDELRERAQLVRELLGETPISSSHRAQLDALADRVAEASSGRVTFIAPDGSVVGDSGVAVGQLAELQNHADRPEVVAAMGGDTGTDQRNSQTLRRPLLYLAVPATPSGSNRGVIRVAIGMESVGEAAEELRAVLVAAAALGLVVAFILSFIVSWFMSQSIGRLRDGVRSIADGHLEKRLHWDAGDELGEIAESIDRMAEQLRSRLDDATAEKEQLEAVLGAMVEGVLVLDSEKRIVLANPRLRELLSIWGEVEGRPLIEVARNAELDAALDAATQQDPPIVREIETTGPEPRKILLHAVRLPLGSARSGLVCVLHDVTEIRNLEEVRSDFIANASHELRTPITAIRGFSETLLNTPPDEDLAPYLRVIDRNAERLSHLVDDLLELSRVENQKAPLRTDDIDLGSLVRNLLEDLAPRLKEAEIAASVASEGEIFARADRRAVDRILVNLIDNAIKYSNSGDSLSVSIAQSGDRARIDVADTGIGIPEKDQSRIFERFYRVDMARSRALGGTGLGLAIVKHLAQAMGGEVHFKSRAGEGSTFHVVLPLSDGN